MWASDALPCAASKAPGAALYLSRVVLVCFLFNWLWGGVGELRFLHRDSEGPWAGRRSRSPIGWSQSTARTVKQREPGLREGRRMEGHRKKYNQETEDRHPPGPAFAA